MKNWCNSLTTSGVTSPTGRCFVRDKLEMTSGEKQLFNALCKNRSKTSTTGEAWTQNKKAPRLKYSHSDTIANLMPLSIQPLTTTHLRQDSITTEERVPPRSRENSASRRPIIPLQRRRTTVHIYLPKLDDEHTEEEEEEEVCGSVSDTESVCSSGCVSDEDLRQSKESTFIDSRPPSSLAMSTRSQTEFLSMSTIVYN